VPLQSPPGVIFRRAELVTPLLNEEGAGVVRTIVLKPHGLAHSLASLEAFFTLERSSSACDF
jgi:hypothetical protein